MAVSGLIHDLLMKNTQHIQYRPSKGFFVNDGKADHDVEIMHDMINGFYPAVVSPYKQQAKDKLEKMGQVAWDNIRGFHHNVDELMHNRPLRRLHQQQIHDYNMRNPVYTQTRSQY